MNHRCPTEAKLPTHCGSEAKPHSSLCDDFPSLLGFAPQNGNHLMESSIGEWFGLSAISKKCAKTAIPYTTVFHGIKSILATRIEIAVNTTSLWLGEASLLGNTSLFVLAKCDWFRGKNRITNKGKISKYGAILLCFPLEKCIADINKMAAIVRERRITREVFFVKVMHDFPCKPSSDITQYFSVIAES